MQIKYRLQHITLKFANVTLQLPTNHAQLAIRSRDIIESTNGHSQFRFQGQPA